MKTYVVWDNDENHFLDGFFGTTDIDGALHYAKLADAELAANSGDNRIVLEWK